MNTREVHISYSTESIQKMIREKERRGDALIAHNTDTAVLTSKISNGWIDKANILTQEEFIDVLRKNEKR